MVKTSNWVYTNDEDMFLILADNLNEFLAEGAATEEDVEEFYNGNWLVEYIVQPKYTQPNRWRVVVSAAPNRQELANQPEWVVEEYSEEEVLEYFPFLKEELQEEKEWAGV